MQDNKRNLVYFEAGSMRDLYALMDTWQTDKRKRLQSVSVERDGSQFCCIALTNPSEVVIVSAGAFDKGAWVSNNKLLVSTSL